MKSASYPLWGMVEDLSCCGPVFLPKDLHGNLVTEHGLIKSLKSWEILNENLVASDRNPKIGHDSIFHQDNDVKHVAKSTGLGLYEYQRYYIYTSFIKVFQ
ncbi:hypothetical protein AMECASPLE_006985 [Ameca splendens]|uniref:Uncharacterized protein n=1 Tax=Ameca splendens TaxID=208324 RepID=A0ABV0YLZ9_9TELE